MTPTPNIPFPLRAVRAALRKLNTFLSRRQEAIVAKRLARNEPDESAERFAAAEAALRQLNLYDGKGREYFETHLPRLARTLSLIPPPVSSKTALELGAYMQLTPFVVRFSGYSSVRGAHFGPLGTTEQKEARVAGQRFEASVDLFDAERDPFPYPDGSFELVLCCELIEHLQYDPMHMVRECHRILEEGGRLLVTTPNAGSLTSVANALHGYGSPLIYSQFSMPVKGEPANVPHVREYTAFELRDMMEFGGFEIETLVTEPIALFAKNLPMLAFLEEHGYNTSMRGEQTYLIAIKRAKLPVVRYPKFLYTG